VTRNRNRTPVMIRLRLQMLEPLKSSASRSASHCFAAAPWHLGQCRLRQPHPESWGNVLRATYRRSLNVPESEHEQPYKNSGLHGCGSEKFEHGCGIVYIDEPPRKAGPASVIHNADTRLNDRNLESSKMVHAALLLLMLEAVTTGLVSPSA
jgi:hypothetical protein